MRFTLVQMTHSIHTELFVHLFIYLIFVCVDVVCFSRSREMKKKPERNVPVVIGFNYISIALSWLQKKNRCVHYYFTIFNQHIHSHSEQCDVYFSNYIGFILKIFRRVSHFIKTSLFLFVPFVCLFAAIFFSSSSLFRHIWPNVVGVASPPRRVAVVLVPVTSLQRGCFNGFNIYLFIDTKAIRRNVSLFICISFAQNVYLHRSSSCHKHSYVIVPF